MPRYGPRTPGQPGSLSRPRQQRRLDHRLLCRCRIVGASSGPSPEPGPVVTSISPTSGSTAGGTSVTINGSGFTGASAVEFGTDPAPSFTVNSDKKITAVSPAEALGTVSVTVTTPGGTSATAPSDAFTFSASAGCTESWTGAVDSEWSDAGNWSNGQVPSYDDEACIPSGAPNLPVDLAWGTSASIRSLSNEGSLDVAGSLAISGTSSISTGSLVVSGTVTDGGVVNVTGTLTTNGATFAGPGTVTAASGSTWEVSSLSTTTVTGGTLVNAGTATIDAEATLDIGTGATVTNSGTLTMDTGSQIYGYNANSVFDNTGTLAASPGSTGTATFDGGDAHRQQHRVDPAGLGDPCGLRNHLEPQCRIGQRHRDARCRRHPRGQHRPEPGRPPRDLGHGHRQRRPQRDRHADHQRGHFRWPRDGHRGQRIDLGGQLVRARRRSTAARWSTPARPPSMPDPSSTSARVPP